MCGRYALSKAPADIAAEFDAVDATGDNPPGPDYKPDFNIAPTKPVLAVVQRHPRTEHGVDVSRTERTVRVFRWGLVPSWAKDTSGAARMINARSETAAVKPSFRRALATRRCILPADGWYEWRRTGRKRPYFITGGRRSLAMAGLWEFWRGPGGDTLVTAAVLTTAAVGPLADIHERMPLLLAPADWDAWLNPDSGPPEHLLRPPAESAVAALEVRPVSERVNNVRNRGPELVERAEPDEADQAGAAVDLALDLSGI